MLSQIIVQILDTLRFLTPFGSLGATYTVHRRLIGNLVFLFTSIELVSLGVTAEALRANIGWKSAFFNGVGQF